MIVYHSPTLNEENLMFTYKSLFNDTMTYYFGEEHGFLHANNINVKTSSIEAVAIDEYLVGLINGYINMTIEGRLEKYLMELIKDEWFHQWPMVCWAYASRLLYDEKSSDRVIKQAVSTLLSLAKDGCPNALYDIAYCYCYGIGLERSYERAICLWLIASSRGYTKAYEQLKLEYELSRSKELPDELRWYLVNDILWILIEEYNVSVTDLMIDLVGHNGNVQKEITKVYNECKRLHKFICNKALLRHTGHLCWSDEDNPYSIGIKIK